jgi:hypothetical protein
MSSLDEVKDWLFQWAIFSVFYRTARSWEAETAKSLNKSVKLIDGLGTMGKGRR